MKEVEIEFGTVFEPIWAEDSPYKKYVVLELHEKTFGSGYLDETDPDKPRLFAPGTHDAEAIKKILSQMSFEEVAQAWGRTFRISEDVLDIFRREANKPPRIYKTST